MLRWLFSGEGFLSLALSLSLSLSLSLFLSLSKSLLWQRFVGEYSQPAIPAHSILLPWRQCVIRAQAVLFCARNAFLRGLGCSKTHTSALEKIAKFCSDWAWAWPAGSILPPDIRQGWDKGASMFMRFGEIIAFIYLNIYEFSTSVSSKRVCPTGSQLLCISDVNFNFLTLSYFLSFLTSSLEMHLYASSVYSKHRKLCIPIRICENFENIQRLG